MSFATESLSETESEPGVVVNAPGASTGGVGRWLVPYEVLRDAVVGMWFLCTGLGADADVVDFYWDAGEAFDQGAIRRRMGMSPEACRAIGTAYRWALGREPDASGLAHYREELASGRLSVQRLRMVLFESEEARGKRAAVLAAAAAAAAAGGGVPGNDGSHGGDEGGRPTNPMIPMTPSQGASESGAPSRPLWVGNFLWDNARKTTHTLMSDFLHNGRMPDRGASDAVRGDLIEVQRMAGMSRFHVYAYNDDNYSERRGGPHWVGLPNRALAFREDDTAHWFHWFHEVRRAGMRITLWLWPNDSRGNLNDVRVWPDERVVEAMARAIRFSQLPCSFGGALVDELVLKLEADDEWSVDRINRIARKVRPLLGAGQTLWYHNQLMEACRGVDWSLFDGIRIQAGHRSDDWSGKDGNWSTDGLKAAMRLAIAQVPEHLGLYFSEFTPDGFRDEFLGSALLRDLTGEFPGRVWGSDNGGVL
jgi:hypothetical protein